MFLKNFVKMILAGNYSDSNKDPQWRTFSRIEDPNGTMKSLGGNAYSYEYCITNYKPFANVWLRFGTSDIPVDYNQCALGNMLDQNEDFNSVTINKTFGFYRDGTFEMFWNVVVNSKTDMTIKEIGLAKDCVNGTGSVAGKYLIYREVLDTPIQLTAGQDKNFAIKIKFNFAV